MRKTMTVVYHGTDHDFCDEYFAVGQISYFDSPPAAYGFWVSEDRSVAERFIGLFGPRPRVLIFEMDTSNAIPWDDKYNYLNYQEVEALKESGVTALLGAEGYTSHVVYDWRCLRLVGVDEDEKRYDDEMEGLDADYY